MASPGAVRIDKWLWAARFFKTRSAAQQAIDGGKVRLNGERTKPAKDLKPGDRLAIRIEAYEWAITVLRLSVQRACNARAGALRRKRRKPLTAWTGSREAPFPTCSGAQRSSD